MSRSDEQVRFRLPAETKTWLTDKAKQSRRSTNAQLVFMLEEIRTAETTKRKKRST